MHKFFCSIALLFSLHVHATQTIEIVVPFPAGGATDIVARAIQQELTVNVNANIIVVNKPGADGIIAGQYFMANQSNKIMMATTGSTLFAKLNNPTLPYDAINDFEIIGPLVTTSTMVAVSDKSQYSDFADMVEKSQKTPVLCGTSNAMAVFFGNYLAKTRNLRVILVPYKGTTPMLFDLEGGHINCAIDALPGFVGRLVKPMLLSTRDHSNNFETTTLTAHRYKFENFFTVALGKTMDPMLKQQITQTIMGLSRNKDFTKSMASKGYNVNEQFSLDYTTKLDQDYLYLLGIK